MLPDGELNLLPFSVVQKIKESKAWCKVENESHHSLRDSG